MALARGAGKPSAEVEGLFVLLDKDVNGRLTPNEMRPMAAFANEL
jgi:Ca2+-binding EF-hand superfamily protein